MKTGLLDAPERAAPIVQLVEVKDLLPDELRRLLWAAADEARQ